MDAPALAAATDRLAKDPRLDGVRAAIGRLSDVIGGGPAADVLGGSWLGHPLHPMLTDLPIGFWTSASVLDLCGRDHQRAADLMVAAGLASTVPTIAAGLVDWRAMSEPGKRVGTLHASANGLATALYLGSLLLRRRGRRFSGVALGMAGATAASFGGYLGGRLAFEDAVGRADRSPTSGTAASRPDEPHDADIVDQQGAALGELADDADGPHPEPDLEGAGPAAEQGIVDQQGAVLAQMPDELPVDDA